MHPQARGLRHPLVRGAGGAGEPRPAGARSRLRRVSPISAGERLYTLADFYRLAALRACDVVQMDIAHCGGLLGQQEDRGDSAAQDMSVSPHCSIGPVAFAAAIHFAYSTPNMTLQECFSEYDVDWRKDLVGGWDPIDGGKLKLPEGPGLGIDIDEGAIRAHPYKALSFPSLWDRDWTEDFTGSTHVPPTTRRSDG